MPQFPNLSVNEGLRGVVCLLIVVWHSALTNIPSDPSDAQYLWFLPLGVVARECVLIFIVLSGFLLGRHWVGTGSRRAIAAGAAVYAKRRLWRMLPPYWAALTVVLFCMLVLGLREPSGTHWDTGLPLTWERVVSNYTLMTDLLFEVPLSHQFWTVATELHLYALGPLIVLFARRRAVLVVLSVLMTAAIVLLAPHYHAPYFPLIFTVSFWLGLERQSVKSQPLAATVRLWWPIAAASLALVALVAVTGTLSDSTRNYFVADALFGPVFCLWLLHIDFTRGRGPIVRVLEWKPFAWAGQRSYSIYLMHAVVIELLWRGVAEPLGASDRAIDIIGLATASILLSIAAGLVLYNTVELPSAKKSSSMRLAKVQPEESVEGVR